MALGEYRPPNQINNDEDKYFKMTKIQLLYAFFGLLAGLSIFSLLHVLDIAILNILGIVVAFFLVAGGVAVGGITLPNAKYLKGGGLRADKYLLRRLRKKYMRKYGIVYVRNIDRDKLVSYESRKTVQGDEKTSIFQDLKSMLGGD